MVASSNSAVAISFAGNLESLVRPVNIWRKKLSKKRLKIKVEKHILAPVHKKVSESERKKILEKYNITFKDLPNILIDDSSLIDLDVKEGDVVKIIRKSPTAGEIVFYRGVVNV